MFEGISAQLGQIVLVAVTTGGIVWGFAGWLNTKFETLRKQIATTSASVIDKLEYHERHDDKRFESVNNELWAIKVRNASKDGYLPPAK